MERERALDRLAHLVYTEGKSPSHRELAEELGISRSAIPNLLERLYATAERERPLIGRLRDTFVRRLDAQYRRSLDVYEASVARGDNRTAVEALRAGNDAIARAGKLSGVEDARTNEGSEGGGFRARLVIEGAWGEQDGFPPAAIAAAARIATVSPAPGPAAIPCAQGTDSRRDRGPTVG